MLSHIRDIDRREFEALHPDYDYTPLLKHAALDHKCSFTALYKGEPVFLFGVTQAPFCSHLGHGWGFGTDKTWRALPTMTAFLKEIVRPDMRTAGVIRIEIRVIEEHHESRHWFENHLGFVHECELANFGARGETFHQYAWVTP